MATFKRKSGGSFVNVAAVKRRSGGAWTSVSFVKRRSGGSWVTVWPLTALAATASPTTLSGTAIDTGIPTTTVTTDSFTTATASGGTGSYTYSWVRVSGSAAISANSPTAASTTFSGDVTSAPGAVTTISAVFKCVVDDGSTTADSNEVTVELTYDRS